VREERQHLDDEVLLRDEVGVEDDEELALHDRERVVDVAGLRSVGAEPADVARTLFGGEDAHLV